MTRRALILTALLLSFTVWLDSAARPTAPPARSPLGELPLQIADWQGRQEPPLDASVLKVLGADDYVNRTYHRAKVGDAVGLYVGYHNSQRQGASIHSPMNCLPGAGWLPSVARHSRLSVDEHSPVVNNVTIVKGEQKQLVLYWYQSQGRIVASEYASKAYLFADAVRRGRTDAALVRIIVPIVNDNEVAALASGRDFAGALLPLLDAYVPR